MTKFKGSSIPDCIIKNKFNQLFELKREKKHVITKKVIYANVPDEPIEMLIMEITDGIFMIPALFEANMIRDKFKLSTFNEADCKELSDKLIDINEYMISAYRGSTDIRPYIIVFDLDYVPNQVTLDTGPIQDVCNNYNVMQWIRSLKAALNQPNNPISSFFQSKGKCLWLQTKTNITRSIIVVLIEKYPHFNRIEAGLEFYLKLIYDNKSPKKKSDIRALSFQLDDILNSNKKRRVVDHTPKRANIPLPYNGMSKFTVQRLATVRNETIAKDEISEERTRKQESATIKHAKITAVQEQESTIIDEPENTIINEPEIIMIDESEIITRQEPENTTLPIPSNIKIQVKLKRTSTSSADSQVFKKSKLFDVSKSQPTPLNLSETADSIKKQLTFEEYQHMVQAKFDTMTDIPDEECIIPSMAVATSMPKDTVDLSIVDSIPEPLVQKPIVLIDPYKKRNDLIKLRTLTFLKYCEF